jgi:hypothetical protein
VLGLLGFYDELDDRSGQPNGSIRDAVRSVGETDEAELVAYLDAGHVLIDVMEGGHDVITGSLRYDQTMPLVGWASAVPWRSTATTLVPEPRAVTSRAQFDAAMLAQVRNRPQGIWGKRRKPRKA